MRRLFLALMLLLSWPVSAQDYYWDFDDNHNVQYSSPQAACDGYLVPLGHNIVGVVLSSETNAQCQCDYSGTLQLCGPAMTRYGDSCPQGAAYDQSTGECQVPLVCLGLTRIDESVPLGTCPFDYVTDCMRAGNSFNACVGDVANGLSDLTGIDLTTITPTSPENCLATPERELCFVENPPGQSCGMVNGAKVCVDNSKPECRTASLMTGGTKQVCTGGATPDVKDNQTADKETTSLNVSSEVNNVTIGDTYNIRTSASSTTNSTGGTDSGGEAGTSPTPDDEKQDGFVSGGETCGQPPVCKGDAIQCAVLKQQYLQRCPSGAATSTDLYQADDQLTFGSVLADFQTDIQNAQVATAIDNFFSFSGGGTCPVWSVNVWEFNITIDQQCSPSIPWSLISGVLIAVAALVAVRVAFT